MRLHVLDVGNVCLTQVLIGNNGRGSGQPRKIKSLGSCVESDAVQGVLMPQSGKRRVFVTRQNQIAVDFVRDDQHIVFQADFA